MIAIKRAYEKASKQDGIRILVDRLWPRGVSKEEADIVLWIKDVAPSDDLRIWFDHDPKKWEEFKKRYKEELTQKKDVVGHDPEEMDHFKNTYFNSLKVHHRTFLHNLKELSKQHHITLVYAAHDEQHNNAVVLKEYIEHL